MTYMNDKPLPVSPRDPSVKRIVVTNAQTMEGNPAIPLKSVDFTKPRGKCPKCGADMGDQTYPKDGTMWCGNIKCGFELKPPVDVREGIRREQPEFHVSFTDEEIEMLVELLAGIPDADAFAAFNTPSGRLVIERLESRKPGVPWVKVILVGGALLAALLAMWGYHG